MRQKLSLFDWRKVCALFATIFLFGIKAALADVGTAVDINSTNTIENQQTVYFTPASNGYVLVEFGQTVDLISPNGVFYDYNASYGADYAQNAVACNGQEAGVQNTSGYGSFEGYTGVTKAVYEVTGGKPYCIWNTFQSDLKVTTSFSTTLPDINGGGSSEPEQPSEPIDFNQFTVSPANLSNEPGITEFWGATLTWNYPVQILDPSKIFVQGADFTMYTGTNGLKVSVNGNSLLIDVVNGPLRNSSAWQSWSSLGVEDGGISVNGQVLENEGYGVSRMITWAPGGMMIPEPTSVPAKGMNPQVGTMDKISLSWNGFWVGYSDICDSWNNARNRIKLYEVDKNSLDYTSGRAIAFTLSQEGAANAGTRWYNTLIVTPAETISNPNYKYVLIIPSNTLGFKDKDTEDTLDDYSELLELVYTVAGADAAIVIPGQYQHLDYKQFKGLQIEGGNYTVSNASQIGLYAGWFDTDNPITDATPIATGVNQGSDGNILIAFPAAGELTSGNYTINVPNGAITGFSVPVSDLGNPAGQIQFVIEGNNPTIESLTVGSAPANNATVETLESVKVWWGNHNKLFNPRSTADPESGEADNTPIAGTMSVNGGQVQNVNFYITRSLIASAEDEDTGEADGVDYEYSLVYTPVTPIVAAGKYTFTIPANSVNVYINNFASPANNQVVLNYTVEGVDEPEPDGTNVNLSFTGVDNAWELITLIDGNTGAPIDLDGATYDLSFDGDDFALLVGINSEYDLAITAEGVEQSYDTFMVGENDPMDDMDVYPVTIYPGLNGKTLVFTVSKEDASGSVANKLYVAQGPNMDNIAAANPASDPVLELQDNGNYVGSFEIEGMNAAFRFYSYVDGVYTYYSPESGGFAGNLWTSFANGTVTTNGLYEATSAGNSGSWRINGYPEGSTGGIVTAVVNLGSTYDTEVTKLITDAVVTLSFEPTVSGTPDLPEELLVVTDTGNFGSFSPTATGGTVGTFKLGEDGTYEGDFTISSRTYFKFYALDNGTATYYSAFAGGTYTTLDFNLEDTFTYNTIVQGNAFGTGGWIAPANTTIHAVVDLAKNTITITKVEGQEGPGGDENYPENVYIVWARSAFSSFSPSASDQEMTNDEDGVFTASFQFSTSDTNKAFRLYSKEDGVITYITPRVGDNSWGQDDTVNFSSDLSKEYTNVLITSTGDPGSWTIGAFPEGMTEGTIEISLDLSTKTFIITLVPEEVKEPETVYIAFAPNGQAISKDMLNPVADLQMDMQQDGSYLFEYELSNETKDYFGFLMYTVDGSNYMSIGEQGGATWGKGSNIELPKPGENMEETFTGLKQYPVGAAYSGDQSSFTFVNNNSFVSGNATLKLSADLQTLEVLVTSDKAEEPGIQLPEMIANPVDGSTLRNVFAAEPAVRWGENRLRLINSKGFSVIQDNGNKNITSDFILQLTEYCPNENTSLEDVQAVISYTDIWPLDNGSYTYTINAGAVQINYNGQWVDCPQIVLHYTLGAQQTVTLPPATIVPEDGSKVTDLKNVTLSWPAFYVQQRGNGEGGMLKNITYTVNGGSPKVIDVTYEGDEAPGMEGYYSTIVLPINATESGKYVVTVPAGALYVASENAGSLENEEIVLTYDVTVTETPAPVYMTGGSVDPRDGSRLANMGDVYITWGNYTLDINPEPNKDYVNLPIDKVTATLNGEKVNLNSMFGVIFRAINTQGSDEGNGGTSTFHVAEIQFYPGDLSFYWSGTLNLKFEEGLVKSTTGAISPAFDLTYYLGGQEVVSPAIFTPEEGSKFLPGEAVVYAEWNGYNVTAINGGLTVNTINEEGDVSASTSISNNQLSIEGGKLKIDLTSLPAGSYQMWLHQGAVNLGNNAVNADAPYAFTIALPEPEGPEATDIDPAINLADGKITISWDGNEIEITDDFNLTIIDNTTGEEVNIWDGVVTVDENGNLVIDLEELELGDGDYTLTLAEGSVNIDEDGTITYNNEVTYDFKTSGIDFFTADTEVRYFTIEGVEVKNPAPGQILIRVAGNKVTKVLVK